ncbi:ABC transporter substrate-binding protein [Labrys monachus]|uniref:Multiple sugar transport system substrate-binding protein n=1 Tax=Labrys monachus TaxID=217067 RepID=A0ABU0F7D4_9HYPH|nr:ABC transporter substrate-binding protein [Labrys monachus]MDQ0390520.1 multiple sugar transport system substrate-binding protein [Labrys monachus]
MKSTEIRLGGTSLSGVSRRTVLQGLGMAGLAAGVSLPLGSGARAAGTATLRWWSPQASPDQLKMYQSQIATFEAAHPGVKIAFEPTSDEGYPAQLAAAFASKQLPNIVTHLPSFAAQNYYGQGLLEPMDDVIKAIGEDKYFPGANNVYKTSDGHYCGTAIGNTAADMLWLRKDLMQKAGIDKAPATWDELRTACQKMQTGGIFGAPLPYGLNSMTSLIFIGFIHRAGGQVFTPDLAVAIDSQATYDALDFYKSMREFCPAGATNYSWGESLTAFVSGATATGIYAGRVLANVTAQNPSIADFVTCATYPTKSADIPAWTFNDFPSVFIPKGVDNLAETKAFAAFLFEPAGYIPQLHAAPGHILPVLKTIAEDPAYLANPIIQKYKAEVSLMSSAAAAGNNLGFETAQHKPNLKANEIIASNVIAELVQRVVLNGEEPKATVGDIAKKLDDLMKA